MGDRNLNVILARREKKDEFYTKLEDIANELQHYRKHLVGKVIYCNCDDYRYSNFYRYFRENFERLGLKKLVATCYQNELSGKALKAEFDGTESISELNGDGDFRSEECLELARECDVIVTNPPFSLFIPYFQKLIDEEKKFIIVGSNLAVTNSNAFPHLKTRDVWLGVGQCREFDTPYDIEPKLVQALWFTNLEHGSAIPRIPLVRRYKGFEAEFRKYDNCEAIEVPKVAEIPYDFEGVMGVPISFMEKWNPEQFEVVGAFGGGPSIIGIPFTIDCDGILDGEHKFARILIKNRNPKNEPDDPKKPWL